MNGFTILVDAIQKLAASATPEDGARAVLDGCIQLTGADSGRVYLLSLTTGTYQSVTTTRRRVEHEFAPPTDPDSPNAALPLERAVLSARPVVIDVLADSPYSWSSRLVLPAVRSGTTCVGLVDLRSDTPAHFSDLATDEVGSLAQLLDVLFERRFTLRSLQSGFASVHYDQGEPQFHDDVLLYAASASQMEYLTLRELTPLQTLRALATWGYPDDTNLRDFDVLDLADLPRFERVVRTEQPFVCPDAGVPDPAAPRDDTVSPLARKLRDLPGAGRRRAVRGPDVRRPRALRVQRDRGGELPDHRQHGRRHARALPGLPRQRDEGGDVEQPGHRHDRS